MLEKKFKKKIILLYLPMAMVLLVLSFIFQPISQVQFNITLVAVIAYLLIALIYHYKDKSLTTEGLLEYILLAIVVLLLISGVIL